jgi:fumarylacetoacetase
MIWWQLDETHDPALTSWVSSANGHRDFPIQNLPFGVFAPQGEEARIGVAIGDAILDLRAAAQAGLLPDDAAPACADPTLNRLMALPAEPRRTLRRWLSAALAHAPMRAVLTPMLHDAGACAQLLPARIGDYSDFYVGIHHANNVGRQFRPDAPLLPNYKWVPIGYHGRASSVRVSGTPVIRPRGQIKAPDADMPVHAPTRRLDCELELGVWIAGDNDLGETVPIDAAWDRIGGLTLLNDWSARDVQAWEYQPLGPFLAKNFLTTISPWVVTAEALAPFRVAQSPRPDGDPAPLPYLWGTRDQAHGAVSIDLAITLSTPAMRASGLEPCQIAHSNSADAMYWTAGQIVCHHASGGCDLHAGDLLGTGTLSGPAKGSEGSLIELTNGGKQPITLPGGETRQFLEDGDELALVGHARRQGYRSIGFGPCLGRVVPAS